MPAYNHAIAFILYKPLEHAFRRLAEALSFIDFLRVKIPNGVIFRSFIAGTAHCSLFFITMLSLLSPADLRQPVRLLILLGNVSLTSTVLAMVVAKCIHQKRGAILLLTVNA